MKPTLNEEIEMSAKGVDYVDSLVPTDQDCVNVIKLQIEEMYEKHNIPLNERELKGYSYKNKPDRLPLIIFTFMVISIALWIIAIIKISEL